MFSSLFHHYHQNDHYHRHNFHFYIFIITGTWLCNTCYSVVSDVQKKTHSSELGPGGGMIVIWTMPDKKHFIWVWLPWSLAHQIRYHHHRYLAELNFDIKCTFQLIPIHHPVLFCITLPHHCGDFFGTFIFICCCQLEKQIKLGQICRQYLEGPQASLVNLDNCHQRGGA